MFSTFPYIFSIPARTFSQHKKKQTPTYANESLNSQVSTQTYPQFSPLFAAQAFNASNIFRTPLVIPFVDLRSADQRQLFQMHKHASAIMWAHTFTRPTVEKVAALPLSNKHTHTHPHKHERKQMPSHALWWWTKWHGDPLTSTKTAFKEPCSHRLGWGSSLFSPQLVSFDHSSLKSLLLRRQILRYAL